MSRRRRNTYIPFVLALVPAPAAAQGPGLDSGTVVRVQAPALGLRRERLTVDAQRGDTLVLSGREGVARVVPLAAIERLEVRTGTSRGDGARHGALIGLAVGAVPALALLPVAIHADTHCDDCFVPATLVLAVAGTAFTSLTAGVGALIGYATPREQWQAVAPARLRVGATAAPGGGGAVAVRWAF